MALKTFSSAEKNNKHCKADKTVKMTLFQVCRNHEGFLDDCRHDPRHDLPVRDRRPRSHREYMPFEPRLVSSQTMS